MRIHLLANSHRADALTAASDAAVWLKARSVEVGAHAETAPLIGAEPVLEEDFPTADLVVCFGGDGTLIRAAHLCSEAGTPILGVYYGRFGFVTQCRQDELGACLSNFFDGCARVEDRMMIQADLLRGEKIIATTHCLNEVVLQRSTITRMLTFDVEVDGQQLTNCPADGVMVATPTGSTAYNLSAGGPILDPRVRAMLLTAVAPHTLSSRPLVLAPESSIRFRLTTVGDAVLSVDGQSRFHLLTGDEVRVCQSPRLTRLVAVERNDFLFKLEQRLLWSQGLPWEDPE